MHNPKLHKLLKNFPDQLFCNVIYFFVISKKKIKTFMGKKMRQKKVLPSLYNSFHHHLFAVRGHSGTTTHCFVRLLADWLARYQQKKQLCLCSANATNKVCYSAVFPTLGRAGGLSE